MRLPLVFLHFATASALLPSSSSSSSSSSSAPKLRRWSPLLAQDEHSMEEQVHDVFDSDFDGLIGRRAALAQTSSALLGLAAALSTVVSAPPPAAAAAVELPPLAISATLQPPLLQPSPPPPPSSSSTLTTSSALTAGAPSRSVDTAAILQRAGKKALGGGKAGAAAAVAQVSTLMWLRTTMNYQYANGGTLEDALETLYKEGGVGRLYQGFPFAVVQGPLSRFGDTAANAFVLALLEGVDMDLALKTVLCSVAAGLWRIVIMPIDTVKTTIQVVGAEKGGEQLKERLATQGVS